MSSETIDQPTEKHSSGEIVRRFISAITSKEIDIAAKLAAETIEYDNVPVGAVQGRSEMLAAVQFLTDRAERLEWVIHRQAETGKIVINERTDRFLVGEKWVEIKVAGVFEVEDGQITLWRDYFDLPSFDMQVFMEAD